MYEVLIHEQTLVFVRLGKDFWQPVKGSEPVSVSLSCPEKSVEVRQEEWGKTRPHFS